MVSCSDELAVHSCPLLFLQRQVAMGADCSTVGAYCVTITWQQIFKCDLHVRVAGILLHVTVEHRHLGRYVARQ